MKGGGGGCHGGGMIVTGQNLPGLVLSLGRSVCYEGESKKKFRLDFLLRGCVFTTDMLNISQICTNN